MKYDSRYETDDMPVKKSNKGFYIALAVCLIAVCGVAVATFVGGLSTDKSATQTTETTPTTAVQQAGNPASDVKDDRTTTTATVTTTAPTTTTTTTATTVTTTAEADLFVLPASNQVLLPYCEELMYSETLGEWRTHNGVDFTADEGQDVKATADGTISRIYQDALWGDAIEITHGGNVVSRYFGVKVKELKEGQAVTAGSVIGTVTSIPAEVMMKPHIHVEVLANDKYVDPLTLIRGKTVMVTTTTSAKGTATTATE